MDKKSTESKSDKSASTSATMSEPTIQSAEQKSESRMKHKPHPAENVEASNPTATNVNIKGSGRAQ